MPLREWAKKHIHKKEDSKENIDTSTDNNGTPSFTVLRSDTMGVPRLQIPDEPTLSEKGKLAPRSPSPSPKSPRTPNRLSRLGMHHRSASQQSLPDWTPPAESDPNAERDWEVRATTLAKLRPNSIQASNEDLADLEKLSVREDQPPKSAQSADGRLLPQEASNWVPIDVVDGMSSDDALQEAIRLHESGDLAKATALFKKIAELPVNDENRVLGQLLYGLALRHGWGCEANMSRAVVYLKAAAENAANAEDDALASGLSKGGNLKGELTLAIFELGNCFRNGWGVEKDNKAARQYFETAAHLVSYPLDLTNIQGDPEAAVEAAWHWMNGVGCKRNKKQAAKYYRLGEKAGTKIVGNSWIWKDKYD